MPEKAYIVDKYGHVLRDPGDRHTMNVRQGRVHATPDQRLALDIALEKLGWRPVQWGEGDSLELGLQVNASFVNHTRGMAPFVEIEYVNHYVPGRRYESVVVGSLPRLSGDSPHRYHYGVGDGEDNAYFCFALSGDRLGLDHDPCWDSQHDSPDRDGIVVGTDLGTERSVRVVERKARLLVSR